MILKMWKFVSFVIVSLIYSTNNAQAIKCYKCDFWKNENCGNDLTKLQPEECTDGEISCVTTYSGIKNSIVRECYKKNSKCNSPFCRECYQDGCNTHVGCYECGSTEKEFYLDCRKAAYITICPDIKDKCLTRIKDDKTLEQKCVNNFIQCSKDEAKTCKISDKSFENYAVPFPADRLTCYQCTNHKACNDVNNLIPLPCQIYDENDKCYTIGTSAENMTRGCMSDVNHKCFGETCITCDSNNCNNQMYSRQPSRKCFQCGLMKVNCSPRAKKCQKPVKYWNQTEKCFTQKIGKKVLAGCANDRTKDAKPCNEQYQCTFCDGDGCNISRYFYDFWIKKSSSLKIRKRN